MKKAAIILGTLLLISVLAYWGGYHLVVSKTPEAQPEKEEILKKEFPVQEMPKETFGGHYVAKIEEEMLFIYEMPENTVYDSMRTESMHFPAGELPALREGIVFQSLPEVYEFLENSMS